MDKNKLNTSYLCATGGIGGAGKDFTVGGITTFMGSIASTDKNATTLKDIVNQSLFNTFHAHVKESYRDAETPVSAQFNNNSYSDNYFEEIKNNNSYKLPIDKNLSVRQVLQILGTDVIRNISTDFHVKMLARRILTNESKFVFITDSRFPNEYNFVKSFNSKVSQQEKLDFLSSIAVFEQESLPSKEKIESQIIELLGDNDFSKEISKLLVACFYDSNYLVKSYTTSQTLDNESLQGAHEYSNVFLKELRSGALFVLRDSNRDLPNHSSEKYNNDVIRSIPGAPEDSVFLNNVSPIEDNKQFKAVIEYLILKAAKNYYNDGLLVLDMDIAITDSLPNSIDSLGKIIASASTVPEELSYVLKKYHTQYPTSKQTLNKSTTKIASDEKVQSK